MSKNVSPQARPARSARSRGKVREGNKKLDRSAASASSAVNSTTDHTTYRGRLKIFLPRVLITNVIVIPFLLVVAIAGILLTNSSFVALPATIAQLWLISQGAPVASSSTQLAIVPLLPMMGVVALGARRVYGVVKDRVSLADLYVLVACVAGVPLLLSLTAVAMLLDAAQVLPVAVPSVGLVLSRTLMTSLLGFAFGMGSRLWRALLKRFNLPAEIFDGLVIALRYLAGLGAVGLVAVLVSIVAHAGQLGEVFGAYTDPAARGNLIGLSVLYLPNMAMFAAMVLTGVELAIGRGALSLFGAFLVPLPPLPVLVAVPASVWPYAWALLAIALLVGFAVSYRPLLRAQRPLLDVGCAAIWTIVLTAVLLLFTSGSMGQHGFVGPVWWLALLLVPVWLVGSGLVLVGVAKFAARSGADDGGEVVEYAPATAVAEAGGEVGEDGQEAQEGEAEAAEPEVAEDGEETKEADEVTEPADEAETIEAHGTVDNKGIEVESETSVDEDDATQAGNAVPLGLKEKNNDKK
ncbi:cell division protein PerM [Corynebacterium epidermidicanis]|uniref:Uncharacterized protein n=1 Tax=Corynebacterium epidermidicanis TaxID=1050174 RepID=A0A0G3GT00_9CORY|nr:DUF6350 family protein [Corynebacterium epidermidicanis]AKK02648.1 hypothetical protein CEPID_03875 [Corynebacterium epidermidicanis]